MSDDNESQLTPLRGWRLGLLVFLALFFGNAAIDLLHELRKLGHPVAGLLFRSLVTAAITTVLLYAFGGKRLG